MGVSTIGRSKSAWPTSQHTLSIRLLWPFGKVDHPYESVRCTGDVFDSLWCPIARICFSHFCAASQNMNANLFLRPQTTELICDMSLQLPSWFQASKRKPNQTQTPRGQTQVSPEDHSKTSSQPDTFISLETWDDHCGCVATYSLRITLHSLKETSPTSKAIYQNLTKTQLFAQVLLAK